MEKKSKLWIIISLLALLISVLAFLMVIYSSSHSLHWTYSVFSAGIILIVNYLFYFFIYRILRGHFNNAISDFSITSAEDLAVTNNTSCNENVVDDSNLILQKVLPQLDGNFGPPLLQHLVSHFQSVQAFLYLWNDKIGMFETVASFAYYSDTMPKPFSLGETVAGQVALNGNPLLIDNLSLHEVKIISSLGSSDPVSVLFIATSAELERKAVIEMAFFYKPDKNKIKLINKVFNEAMKTYNN